MKLRPAVWLPVAILPAMLLLFEPTGLDLYLQDFAWDMSGGGHWVVDAHAEWPRLLFYRIPRWIVAGIGVSALLVWLAGSWNETYRPWRRRCLLIALSVALVPGTVGLLKASTNVHCPSQLTRYGGNQPYDGIAARLFNPVETTTRGRCFPAGHASGAFALLALGWLAGTRRFRLAGWGIGLLAGSVTGAYQMAKGVHFMSHTLTTLLLALAITAGLAAVIWPKPRSTPELDA